MGIKQAGRIKVVGEFTNKDLGRVGEVEIIFRGDNELVRGRHKMLQQAVSDAVCQVLPGFQEAKWGELGFQPRRRAW